MRTDRACAPWWDLPPGSGSLDEVGRSAGDTGGATVNRLARAVLAEALPAERDLQDINHWARRPPLTLQAGAGLQRRWVGGNPVQAALALIAREAVELMTSSERNLIRECAAAPNCSLLYLDRSRAQRRRWCQMEICGSRAKMTSYRRRRGTSVQPVEERTSR